MIEIDGFSTEDKFKQINSYIVEVKTYIDNLREIIEHDKKKFPDTMKSIADKRESAIIQYKILKAKFGKAWDYYYLAEIIKETDKKTNLEYFIKESLKITIILRDILETAFSLNKSIKKKIIKEQNIRSKRNVNKNKEICEFEQNIIQKLKNETFLLNYTKENGHIVTLIVKNSYGDESYSGIFWKTLSKLKYLKKLSLSTNNLIKLPEPLKNLKDLTHLNLERNKLSSLPEWFGDFKNLVDLRLNNNDLYSLPESFGNLEDLEILVLSHNQLTFLPESFQNFHYLKSLNLGYNKFRSFTNLPIQYFVIENWPERILEGNNCNQKGESLYYNTEEFFKYYSKPTLKLAQQYFENTNSLTEEEKERLAWEGSFRERKILELDELKIPPNDPILLRINER
ncbi:MAG: leucine-rich repeat domain-containing protein [Promethearchaeota archaeon]